MEGVLVPFIVIGFPLIFAAIAIYIKSIKTRKRDQLKADLYLKAIEKGEKIPDNLFKESEKKDNSLRTAIILISIGVGLSLFMFLVTSPDPKVQIQATATGLIPLFLGLGFLIIHFTQKKRGNSDNEE